MKNTGEDSGVVFVMLFLLLVSILAAVTGNDIHNRYKFGIMLTEQVGGVSATYSGALSGYSAVQLWVVDFSEKPSEVFACVGSIDNFVCQPYKVQP